MHRYKSVLFDLDGTIIDSAEGIFNSLEFSLKHFGIFQPREAFYKYLGPSLRQSFSDFLPQDKIEEAISVYRERYSSKGLYEAKLYDGIKEMLLELKAAGYIIALATAKPEVYAKIILKHFGIDNLFNFVGGATLDTSRDTKAKIIEYVMTQLKLEKSNTIMIGDRVNDIQGAAKCNIDSAGVLYGYGSREELCEGYAPVYIANTTHELSKWLLNNIEV